MEPPKQIPEEMYDEFTMDSKCKVYDWYFNHAMPNNEGPDWDRCIYDYIARFTNYNILENLHGSETYAYASLLHVQALEKYPIMGKSVAVVGSLTPWLECILLNNGAREVTTVEYNVPKCTRINNLNIVTYDDFCKSEKRYDAIFSYSSIEHSGLGRYGDSLNPNGDIDTLMEIMNHLEMDGLLYLGIPVGIDGIAWNAHRIYGKHRLALIAELFIELDWIGTVTRSYLSNAKEINAGPQPIIIYKPKFKRMWK
jgi:hypothetical protein